MSVRPPFKSAPTQLLLLSLGLVVAWGIWAAAFNSAQFGDNIEQFNWAQNLELGYHKHPPLPSWLLWLFVQLAGPSIYWAYVLAVTCLLGAMAFTWLLARRLIGAAAASAAVSLMGLSMTFAQRAQLYNHNTVLVVFIAATAWFSMRASDERHRTNLPIWLVTGACAAGAVLSKYQAVVPLTGIVLALLLSGRLANTANRIGLSLALMTLLGLCAPHAGWLVRHDYSTLRYASEAIVESTPWQRLGFVLGFAVNQMRIWSSSLVALLLLAAAHRYRSVQAHVADDERRLQSSDETANWFWGLLWFGLAILVVLALCFGVQLRNHWGVQSLQYLGIWIVWRLNRHNSIDLGRLKWIVLAIHLCNLAWYAGEHIRPMAALSERRIDTSYPAQRLADAAVRHWQLHTRCSLQYVAGTAFDAGLVSLYSGGRTRVFDSETATPWIKPAQLRSEGAVYVLEPDDVVPPEVVDLIDFPVVPEAGADPRAKIIRIGLRYPAKPCGAAATPTEKPPLRSS